MVQHFVKDSWLNMRKLGEGALLNELHQQDLLQFQKRKIGWNRILHSLMTETRIYINCLISRKREIKRWLPGILKCKTEWARMDCATEWRHIWEDRSGAKTGLGMDGWLQSEEVGGWHLSCTQLLQTTGVPLSALHSDSFVWLGTLIETTQCAELHSNEWNSCLTTAVLQTHSRLFDLTSICKKHYWIGQHFKVIHIV